MSLQKCAKDMEAHTSGWDLRECARKASESWLKDCIGKDFDVDKYLLGSDEDAHSDWRMKTKSYSMSLAQQCEYAWYGKLLNSLSDRDRLRLLSNSGKNYSAVMTPHRSKVEFLDYRLELFQWSYFQHQLKVKCLCLISTKR